MKSYTQHKKERSEFDSFDWLSESENQAVKELLEQLEEDGVDITQLDEGILKKLIGGTAGFVIGPAIGKAVAKALGIEKGILYDMFKSRLVSAALGAAIAEQIGKR